MFWKKDACNKNTPYSCQNLGDELLIIILDDDKQGVFVLPKHIAISKGILSTDNTIGKMAMRFYPPWCENLNKTDLSAQKWQIDYFGYL